MKILILCNNASGLSIFRGMLVEELIISGCLLYAVIPQTQDKSELQAENRLKKAGCTLKKMPIDRRGINPFKDFRLFFALFKIYFVSKPRQNNHIHNKTEYLRWSGFKNSAQKILHQYHRHGNCV